MTPLIIFGASSHARVIIDAVRCGAHFQLVGVIGEDGSAGGELDGVPVYGGERDVLRIREMHRGVQGIIGIGDNQVREAVAQRILRLLPDFVFSSVVHPATTIAADVRPGIGTFVSAGAIINVGSRVGDHIIINTRASIDHDCVLDDFSFIAPGATLAGGVMVRRGAFVGTGACVIPDRLIGMRAVVGAGAAVIRDVPEDTVVGGVPACRIKLVKPEA